MPTVTIVIPAYNAESTIAETLSSVLAQTYRDFEVLVVDDGSTDKTSGVVSAAEDQRVRLVRIPNGGVARARNHGISQARAELVAFLDADDLWEPDKLELQVAALEASPQAGLCVTAAVRINERGKILGKIPAEHSDDVCRTLLLNAMSVGMLSSGLVRASVLKAIGGFDPRFSQCADWDLWLRVSTTSAFCVIDRPLVRYRTFNGNMSSDISLLERDTFAVLDAFFSSEMSSPYRSIRSRVYSRYWMMCSGAYFQTGHLSDAVRCGLRGVIANPSAVGRLFGLPVRWARRKGLRRADAC